MTIVTIITDKTDNSNVCVGDALVFCCHSNSCSNRSSLRAEVLTRSLVSVGLGGDVVLDLSLLEARHLLHLVDLRHAEFGVVMEKHASLQDGQLVLGPVPQLPQVLVVQRVEGVISIRANKALHGHSHNHNQVGVLIKSSLSNLRSKCLSVPMKARRAYRNPPHHVIESHLVKSDQKQPPQRHF